MQRLPEILMSMPPDGASRAAEVTFPAGCVWFDGHFPDRPVLPGVALLVAVRAVIARGDGRTAEARRVVGFGRVRFRSPVAPDQRLLLVVRPGLRPGTLAFEFSRQGERICEGAAEWEAASPAPDDPAWRWR